MILPQRHSTKSPVTAQGIKVCVVDSSFGDYQPLLAERKLHSVQWELISNGRDALRQAQHNAATVWVVNTHLPDMTGIDLCQMLKAQSSSTIVFLLTDEYSAAEERAAWLAGAALFRPKPIDPSWFEPFVERRRHVKAM